MNKINNTRRSVLTLGIATLGLGLFSKFSLAAVSTPKPSLNITRTLKIRAINTNEVITSTYYVAGKYVQSELGRLHKFMRDFRTGDSHKIDKALFDRLHEIQQHFGTDKELRLISGYRSPKTNNNLRGKSASTGVAKNSLHMKGMAIDFNIEGVKLSEVLKYVMKTSKGGVGYYPKSNFIHIDSGTNRYWPRAEINQAINKTA